MATIRDVEQHLNDALNRATECLDDLKAARRAADPVEHDIDTEDLYIRLSNRVREMKILEERIEEEYDRIVEELKPLNDPRGD